jgi:hypothetical protein
VDVVIHALVSHESSPVDNLPDPFSLVCHYCTYDEGQKKANQHQEDHSNVRGPIRQNPFQQNIRDEGDDEFRVRGRATDFDMHDIGNRDPTDEQGGPSLNGRYRLAVLLQRFKNESRGQCQEKQDCCQFEEVESKKPPVDQLGVEHRPEQIEKLDDKGFHSGGFFGVQRSRGPLLGACKGTAFLAGEWARRSVVV